MEDEKPLKPNWDHPPSVTTSPAAPRWNSQPTRRPRPLRFPRKKTDGGAPRGKCPGVVGSGGFERFDVRKGHEVFNFFFS